MTSKPRLRTLLLVTSGVSAVAAGAAAQNAIGAGSAGARSTRPDDFWESDPNVVNVGEPPVFSRRAVFLLDARV